MWKIKLQKIVGNLLDELWKFYMNGTVKSFSPPQGMKSSMENLRLRTDILQKTVVGCPEITTNNYEC